MTIKASTGLRNKLLDTNPLKTIFNLGFIKIYNGTAPASADDATAGTLILTISNNSTGTGVTFETAAVAGAIAKKTSETWSGVASATLTANYFRLVAAGDTGASSTTEARLQGSIAQAGADLNMTVIALTNTTTYPVDTFAVSLPSF
jgi:hypothetical protein